jgi:hypothetical protein
MEQLPRHVYTLSYVRPTLSGGWEGQFIGVYSSMGEVEEAQGRLRVRADYRDYPNGFSVDCLRLNQDYDEHEFRMIGFPSEE